MVALGPFETGVNVFILSISSSCSTQVICCIQQHRIIIVVIVSSSSPPPTAVASHTCRPTNIPLITITITISYTFPPLLQRILLWRRHQVRQRSIHAKGVLIHAKGFEIHAICVTQHSCTPHPTSQRFSTRWCDRRVCDRRVFQLLEMRI